jgi:hypothetical protein
MESKPGSFSVPNETPCGGASIRVQERISIKETIASNQIVFLCNMISPFSANEEADPCYDKFFTPMNFLRSLKHISL